MNTLLATATYTGERFLDNGLRFMEMSIPQQGKGAVDVPLLVFPNKAAGESFDVFQPGARLLINGRLYPSRQDYRMYFIPNQQFQLINDKSLIINRVNLSGMVGYVQERKMEDLFAFTLMCNAPSQQILGHRSEDGLAFRLDGWGEDARRLTRLVHVGRGLSVEGSLRYNEWSDSSGQTKFSYQVRIRSGLYQAFGKNKNLVAKEDGTPVSEGFKRSPAAQPAPVDATPCSVNADEVPF